MDTFLAVFTLLLRHKKPMTIAAACNIDILIQFPIFKSCSSVLSNKIKLTDAVQQIQQQKFHTVYIWVT